jgi:hypothetical protein
MSSQLLADAIEVMRERARRTPEALRIFLGWHRLIEVCPAEGAPLFLRVSDGEISEPSEARPSGAQSGNVRLEGELDALIDLFRGIANPAVMASDGRLSVIADDRDQMRLDAFTLALWGW